MILKVKNENGQFKEVVLKGLKGDKGDRGEDGTVLQQKEIDDIKSSLDTIMNLKADKELIISVEEFGAVADALYKDNATGMWYTDSTMTKRATDNTNAFATAFNSTYQNIIIPKGVYLINGECVLRTSNKNITCFGDIVVEPRNTKNQLEMNVFCLSKVHDINITGFNLKTDRIIDTTVIWGERPRTIQLSSQRIAFNLCGTKNINFNNMVFDGFEYDFKIDIAHGVTGNNELEINSYVTIENVVSTNCSQPILMNHSSKITINKYDSTVANGLSNMEHFIYFTGYVKHVYVNDCVIRNYDGRLGACFNLRVDGSTNGTTYSDSDIHDVHVNNCTFYGIRSIATATETNDIYINNPVVIGYEKGDDTVPLIALTQGGKAIVTGGYIETGARLLSDAGTSTYCRFNGVEIKTSNMLTSSTTASYNKDIIFSNCDIAITGVHDSQGWLYITGDQGGQIIFNSCNFNFPNKLTSSFLFSIRNQTTNVILNGCLLKCDGDKMANFSYSSGKGGKNLRYINTYFIGFERIASTSEMELATVVNTILETQ